MKWLGGMALCLMVVGFAAPAAAQDTPKAEVSVGYNWLTAKASGDEEWEKFPKGWYADVAGNISDTLSIVGQVTGNYKTFEDEFEDEEFKLNIHTYMAGIRGSSPGRVRGFGQVLVGGVSIKATDELFDLEETETNFALQIGGGVNVLGSGGVGLRVGLDYLRLFAKEDGTVLFGEDVNGFRFNVGVTFGIGSR
ncbi:MAG: outer membrane beta-barrel protein [Vicinamibacterales bacterium]